MLICFYTVIPLISIFFFHQLFLTYIVYFFYNLSIKNTVKIIIPLHFSINCIFTLHLLTTTSLLKSSGVKITFLIVICKYCLAATKRTRFKLGLYCVYHNILFINLEKTYMFTHFKFCSFINEIFIIRKSIVKEFYFIF